MARNTDEMIAFLADIERSIEKAVRLELTTAVYLLRMAALDVQSAVYGQAEGVRPRDSRYEGP